MKLLLENAAQVSRAVTDTLEVLAAFDEFQSATKYLTPKLRVTMTRRFRKGDAGHVDLLLTIGKPNYRGREFVKQCQRAGEPFPVKKVQVKRWPKKRAR